MNSLPATSNSEEICDAFESAWRSGSAPLLADFMAVYQGTDPRQLFIYLLELDVDYQERAGVAVQAESYAARFPEFAAEIAVVFARLPKLAETQPLQQQGTRPHVEAKGATPTMLGPYELLNELGRGGMGIVYRARQRSLNRLVALKLIRSGELAGAEELSRFRREAEAAAALEHPAIVPVYEVGEDRGFVYFSMGLVEGGSLADLVAETTLPERQSAEFVEQIARGVDYAHRQGVIHRDLKPANILLDKQGLPKITDFGLAKRLHDDKELTTTGQVLGTPAYMPPEQARGDLAKIGPASDIYSLGAILYRLLTGRPPFQAASLIDTLQDVIQAEPVPPRQLVPHLATDLETICLKCLDKTPEKRYASGVELANDLQRWRNGEPIHARRSSAWEKSWKWARRNPLIASLSGALVVALLLGTILSSIFGVNANLVSKRERAARITAQKETARANQAVAALKKESAEVRRQKEEVQRQKIEVQKRNEEVERQKAEIQKQLTRADATIHAIQINRALQALEIGNVAEAQRFLNLTATDRRGWEYAYLHGQAQRLLHELPLPGLKAFAFSHDDHWLAVASAADEVRVLQRQTGDVSAELQEPPDPTRVKGLKSEVQQLEFSPDGKLLVVRDKHRVIVWDWRAGRPLHIIDNWNKAHIPWRMRISPNGERLAIGYSGHIFVYALAKGELLKVFEFAAKLEFTQGLDFSPDSEQVISLTHSANRDNADPQPDFFLSTWNLTSAEPLQRHRLADNDKSRDNISVHPNGQQVIQGGVGIQVLDLATGQRRLEAWPVIEHSPWRAEYLDRDRIWSVEGGGRFSTRIVRVWDAERRRPSLSIPLGITDHIETSPGGTIMGVVLGDKLQIWDLRTRPDRETFELAMATGLAWYADNERLAAIGSEAGVVWDARTKEITRRMTISDLRQPASSTLEFSHDRKLIATASASFGAAGGARKGVALRNAETWEPLFEWTQSSHSALFHPNGKQFITNSYEDKQLVLWNLETHQPDRKLPCGSSCAISPDGRWLAVNVEQGEIEIWDLTATAERASYEITWKEGYLAAMLFTPDSKHLIYGDNTRTICLWNLATQQVERRLPGHTLSVWGMCLSPDGKRLATVGGGSPSDAPNREGELKLWDLESGTELLSLPNPGWWPRAVAFSPNGKRLAVGGQAGKVHVFSAP